MSVRNFFAELKRRNVYKVVAYAVIGWLIIQVSSTVLPTFHAPEWVGTERTVEEIEGNPGSKPENRDDNAWHSLD